jgi:inorganic pyrophosphatase
MIRVFIQAAAHSVDKHEYDETTLEHRGIHRLVEPYPFPYGFVLDTQSEDGDNVDCYVITSRPLAVGDIVECEPAAILEQLEDDYVDHKVLAIFPDEPGGITDEVIATLRRFIVIVFAAFPNTKLELGALYDAAAARAHLAARARV